MTAHIIRLPRNEKEDGPPRIICPHCREIIRINLDIWKKNVSELFKIKCYKCHGEAFIGTMILVSSNLNDLLLNIQKIIKAVNPTNKIIGGN